MNSLSLRVKKVSGIKKIVGLIGADSPKPLWFNTRFGIHTFFLRFPIDVVILDDNLHVVCYKEKLLPNRFFFWSTRYKHVLELPANTIKKNHIVQGLRLYLMT
ncbi:MAG: DUF192 domain-containing protein [Candidatus Levybacteria bacterium]|nr:DUF192 domain-containing protein [Candidatus Levybacteria bacterium]